MSNPFDLDAMLRDEQIDVSKTYIVILKSDDNGLDSEDSLSDHWEWVKERDNNGLDSGPEWTLGGYQAKLSESAIEDLKKRPEVEMVVRDRFGTLDVDDDPPANITSSNNAPWNLQRLSSTVSFDQNAKPEALSYTYRRPEVAAAGIADKPVHVYVLDTGIITDHEEFQGRQVFQGPNFSCDQANNHDTKGHGTHVAGTVGGNQCGVARDPGVRITGVKVTTGHGRTLTTVRLSAVNQGLQWVVAQHEANPEVPTVINMSLRFVPGDDALDHLIDQAAARGVHVVVSAGNTGKDATIQSPARARGALAVGASTIMDEPYVKTNLGPKVAIFAPGVGIMSAGIKTPAELVLNTGTSMASPLVAGTIAWLIQQEGNRSPEAMLERLRQLADASGRVVKGVPENTTNRLIWNGVR